MRVLDQEGIAISKVGWRKILPAVGPQEGDLRPPVTAFAGEAGEDQVSPVPVTTS